MICTLSDDDATCAAYALQAKIDTSRWLDARQAGGNAQAWVDKVKAAVAGGKKLAFTEAERWLREAVKAAHLSSY